MVESGSFKALISLVRDVKLLPFTIHVLYNICVEYGKSTSVVYYVSALRDITQCKKEWRVTLIGNMIRTCTETSFAR